MKHYIHIIFLLLLGVISAHARIMSDRDISDFVNRMNRQNTNPNIFFRKDKRTIVLEVYNIDMNFAMAVTPATISGAHTDDIAALMSTNFISQRNILHYTNQYEKPATRIVEASCFEFLGLFDDRYRISLKDEQHSLGVNIEIQEPRGWKKSESRNHFVASYINGSGENQVYYSIQILPLPTFISRREAKEFFDDSFDSDFFDFLKDAEIIDIKEDEIGQYPAMHVKYIQEIIIVSQKIPLYTNCWYIIYEDCAVIIYGAAMRPTEFEKGLYDIMFQTMVSLVRFPDLFDKNYE